MKQVISLPHFSMTVGVIQTVQFYSRLLRNELAVLFKI